MRESGEKIILKLDRIKDRVCEEFCVKKIDLISHRRSKNICIPRHFAMWLARELTTYSFPQIAAQFGNRDHSSVIQGVEKAQARIDSEPFQKQRMERILNELRITL